MKKRHEFIDETIQYENIGGRQYLPLNYFENVKEADDLVIT